MERDTILNDTYIIKERLGGGGGGVVYRAYHRRLETDVVVKQIRDEVRGHIEGRAEADVLKRLHHTFLPRVYDFLEIDGEIFTVMDFIPGRDLGKAIEEYGKFPQKQVLQWAKELSDALAYLHGMNPPIIHSDIKPANIMLKPDGHVCLIDFNISLAFDSTMRTATGISAGFSPPEQYPSRIIYQKKSAIRRQESEATEMLSGPEGPDEETSRLLDGIVGAGVDERSDIYSLGATFYMLRPASNRPVDIGKTYPLIDWADMT